MQTSKRSLKIFHFKVVFPPSWITFSSLITCRNCSLFSSWEFTLKSKAETNSAQICVGWKFSIDLNWNSLKSPRVLFFAFLRRLKVIWEWNETDFSYFSLALCNEKNEKRFLFKSYGTFPCAQPSFIIYGRFLSGRIVHHVIIHSRAHSLNHLVPHSY